MRTKSLNGQKIAELRHFTGTSQARFAAMLGVSKDTIISVENGRNRLSASLARRLRFATGVNNLELLEGTGKLLDYTGNSYTSKSFTKWLAKFPELKGTKAERDTLALASLDFLKGWMELIFVAATRSGTGGLNRFPNVFRSLEEWMVTTCAEFKLGNEIASVLEEWGQKPKGLTVSVKALRADKQFAKRMGFKDSKRYRNSDAIPSPYDWLPTWRTQILELRNPKPYNREALGDHMIFYSFA